LSAKRFYSLNNVKRFYLCTSASEKRAWQFLRLAVPKPRILRLAVPKPRILRLAVPKPRILRLAVPKPRILRLTAGIKKPELQNLRWKIPLLRRF
jgi:hypothetical protein